MSFQKSYLSNTDIVVGRIVDGSGDQQHLQFQRAIYGRFCQRNKQGQLHFY